MHSWAHTFPSLRWCVPLAQPAGQLAATVQFCKSVLNSYAVAERITSPTCAHLPSLCRRASAGVPWWRQCTLCAPTSATPPSTPVSCPTSVPLPSTPAGLPPTPICSATQVLCHSGHAIACPGPCSSISLCTAPTLHLLQATTPSSRAAWARHRFARGGQ